MKKLILYFLLFASNICYGQTSVNVACIDWNDSLITINTSAIDSITFESNGEGFNQIVWCGTNKYISLANDNTELRFEQQNNKYVEYTQQENGIDGLVTNSGNFFLWQDSLGEEKQSLAVLGNIYSSKKEYVCIDSLGYISSFTNDSDTINLLYGTDSLIIYCNGAFLRAVSYENFRSEENYSKIRRASWLTRNPIFTTLDRLSKIKDYINDAKKALIMDMLRSQLGGNYDGLNALLDLIDGLDPLEILKLLDGLLDKNFFGNASITTLEPKKNSMCNYDLGCHTTLPTYDTPFWKENQYRGISATFRIVMDLTEDIIFGNTQAKESLALDEDTWLNFSDLNVNTTYIFEPRLEVEYSISDKAYWLSIGEDPNKIGPQKKRHAIYGETKTINIGNIGGSVGEASDIKDKSAKVEVTFSEVPEAATCGVKVIESSSNNEMFFSCKASTETQKVSISGLKPVTEYVYQAIIKYKGKEYPSYNAGSFTTAPPDISGTWNCTEEYYPHSWSTTPSYKSYSLTLNADGTATCSEYESIASGAWALGRDGSVRVSIMIIATQTTNSGVEWSGKVDSMNNPTKITGGTYNWNYNNIGYFQGDSHSIVMTR